MLSGSSSAAGAPPPPPTCGTPTGSPATAASAGRSRLDGARVEQQPDTGYAATASPGGATCASATLGCAITGLTQRHAVQLSVTATISVGRDRLRRPSCDTAGARDPARRQPRRPGRLGRRPTATTDTSSATGTAAFRPGGLPRVPQPHPGRQGDLGVADHRRPGPHRPDRRAAAVATFYNHSQIQVKLTFANAYSGLLHLYAVDWVHLGGNRYEDVSMTTAAVRGLPTFVALGRVPTPGYTAHRVASEDRCRYSGAYRFLGPRRRDRPPPTVPEHRPGSPATAASGRSLSPGRRPRRTAGADHRLHRDGEPWWRDVRERDARLHDNGDERTATTSPSLRPVRWDRTAIVARRATPLAPVTLPVDSPGVQGTWVSDYGHDGYILGNWNGNDSDLASLPAGVTYSLPRAPGRPGLADRRRTALTDRPRAAASQPSMTSRCQ